MEEDQKAELSGVLLESQNRAPLAGTPGPVLAQLHQRPLLTDKRQSLTHAVAFQNPGPS